MPTTKVNISGMTCGHCVSAVLEELKAINGVEDVNVELNKGGLSQALITSVDRIPTDRISEAVAEAGYVVVSDDA